MLENEGAGAGQNDGQGGDGAPSGGSSEGGSENDDKPITARQLKAALASQRVAFEEKMAAKDRELQAFKEGASTRQQAVERPQRYTRKQLSDAVEAGQISREQADEVWTKQVEADATERAVLAATEAVTAKTTKERIDSDIAAYVRLKPEIKESGSELREKIREEFTYFTRIGKPADTSTELAAIRAVLGPIEKLERAAQAARSQEAHQEAGGGSGRPKGGGGKTLADQLDPRWKEHYEKGIKQGRYADWKAVEAELKFASTARRQSMGLQS